MNIPITISFGDGIGPEIMLSTLHILRQIQAPLHFHTLELGTRAYHHGFRYGIPGSCMDKIMEYKFLLRAPHAAPTEPNFHLLDIPTYLNCTDIYQLGLDNNILHLPSVNSMHAKSYIGEEYAVFEPAHGSVLTLAEQDKANPSGMILAAILLLSHLKLNEQAEKIEQAWLKTLEDGFRTIDIYESDKTDTQLVGTHEFTNAIIERIGLQSRYPQLEIRPYATET